MVRLCADKTLVLVQVRVSGKGALVVPFGEFFDVTDIGIGDRPARPLDVWLGAAAPAALRRIGRFGDGWLASLVDPTQAAADLTARRSGPAGASKVR